MWKVLVDHAMKRMDAEEDTQTSVRRRVQANRKHERRGRTYDGEDERVGEVSVERELHHVPPQLQQLHRLSQTHEDVTAVKEKQTKMAAASPLPPLAVLK